MVEDGGFSSDLLGGYKMAFGFSSGFSRTVLDGFLTKQWLISG